MAVGGFALDRARGLDRASVEEELLGEGSLTRVGVGNDGERPTTLDLLLEVCPVGGFLSLYGCPVGDFSTNINLIYYSRKTPFCQWWG